VFFFRVTHLTFKTHAISTNELVLGAPRFPGSRGLKARHGGLFMERKARLSALSTTAIYCASNKTLPSGESFGGDLSALPNPTPYPHTGTKIV